MSSAEASRANSRLSARAFYGLIAACVVTGSLLAGVGAWAYLREGNRSPEAIRVWGDVATDLVIPVAVMMGGTFGGLVGVAAAVLLDRCSRNQLRSANTD
jgi:hypothetical protein